MVTRYKDVMSVEGGSDFIKDFRDKFEGHRAFYKIANRDIACLPLDYRVVPGETLELFSGKKIWLLFMSGARVYSIKQMARRAAPFGAFADTAMYGGGNALAYNSKEPLILPFIT